MTNLVSPSSSTSLCKIASRTHITRTQLLRRTEGHRGGWTRRISVAAATRNPSVRWCAGFWTAVGRRAYAVRRPNDGELNTDGWRASGRPGRGLLTPVSFKNDLRFPVVAQLTSFIRFNCFITSAFRREFAFSLHVGPFVQPTLPLTTSANNWLISARNVP